MGDTETDYNPHGAQHGRWLESMEWDRDVGDYVFVREQAIPHKSVVLSDVANPSATNSDLMLDEIRNERNENEVRRVQRRYPWRTGQGSATFPSQNRQEHVLERLRQFCDVVNISERVRPYPGTVAPLEDGQISITQERIGPDHIKETLLQTPAGGWLTRVDFETDDETGCPIRITRDVVTSGVLPAPTLQPPGVSLEYEQLSEILFIRTLREQLDPSGDLVTGAAAFTSYVYHTRQNFTFPSYILPFTVVTDIIRALDRNQRRTLFDIRIRTRRSFTANVWAKKTVSFHAAAPAQPTLFEWRYVDWKHDGVLFSVDEPNVLADETTIPAITLLQDTYYGAWNETVVFPASSPLTASAYIGAVGNEQLVDLEVSRIKDRLFQKVETRIFME